MQEVLIPLALGTLLFYALDPVVNWLQRWRIPRALGAAVAVGSFIAALSGLAYALQGQLSAVVDRLPEGARTLREALRPSGPSTFAKVDEAAKELQADAPATARGVIKVQVADAPLATISGLAR